MTYLRYVEKEGALMDQTIEHGESLLEKRIVQAVCDFRRKGYTGALIGFCHEDTYLESGMKNHIVELMGMRFVEHICGLDRLYFSSVMNAGDVRVQAKDYMYNS